MSYTKRRTNASKVSAATAAAAMSKSDYETWWIELLEDTVETYSRGDDDD